MATSDQTLAPGWQHITAVREGGRLRLYIGGQSAAESSTFQPRDYDLSNDHPLRIGFGIGHPFRGAMSDLRLYNRALTPREIEHFAAHAT